MIFEKEKRLYSKEDPKSIQSMFGSIAQNYDKTNAILSLKFHQLWNKRLVREAIIPTEPSSLLDLCCGTGDIAYSYLNRAPKKTQVYMLDFCEEMILSAKEKAEKKGYDKAHDLIFLQADAQHIPLENSLVDCITIAYGIRNVKDPSKCIEEAFRLLKKGGTFGILELTRPKNLFLRFFHQIYLKYFIPVVGKFVTSNQDAYHYLRRSINTFVSPEELQQMLKNCGFSKIEAKPLWGGVATIILGKKE